MSWCALTLGPLPSVSGLCLTEAIPLETKRLHRCLLSKFSFQKKVAFCPVAFPNDLKLTEGQEVTALQQWW